MDTRSDTPYDTATPGTGELYERLFALERERDLVAALLRVRARHERNQRYPPPVLGPLRPRTEGDRR
jgi:hypothetical protein